jgi:hypothetical protein
MPGQAGEIGLLIGGEDRQHMLVDAVSFTLQTNAFAPWPSAVPRIAETASHWPTASCAITR